jgi:hypothetical protein
VRERSVQSLHPSALVVDRHERAPGQGVQIVDQPAQLADVLHVAPKQDYPTRSQAIQNPSRVGVEVRSRDSGEDDVADPVVRAVRHDPLP